uniref:KIB1-4 beta-propeller domain-containing protein n=1 Tax=Aegilops tauschii TaxID=37682 RepID=N1QS24_AEGTA
MRLHGSPRQGLPWIVLEYGAYQALPDSTVHQLPLPWTMTCVSATNDWIALDHVDYAAQKHTYTMYNHFSRVTVPLPELDSFIGKVHEKFEIRKVLMRSTPDDLVAVTGNIWKYPLILCRPGKRAWVARPLVMPYFRIIDFAFLGDMLYAITKAENLYAIHLAEDDEGNPRVSFVKRITKHTPYPNGDRDDHDIWMGTTGNYNEDAPDQEDAPNELVGDDSEIDNDNDHSNAYNVQAATSPFS